VLSEGNPLDRSGLDGQLNGFCAVAKHDQIIVVDE